MRTKPQTDARRRDSEPGKRERNRLDKRDRIRETAERLFTEQGFEATTTATVAAEAGVATGTLFLYVDDKVDLLFLVFNHRMQSAFLSAILGLRRDQPLVEQLASLHEAFFSVYRHLPELGRHFVANLCTARGRGTQAMSSLSFATIAQIVAILREGVAGGEVDKALDAHLAARSVFFLYYGALVAWFSGAVPTVDDACALFRRALELQIRGFAPPASSRRARRRAAPRRRMTRKVPVAAQPSPGVGKQLDKRNRIREAAWRLFSERGYDRTTTKAVADEAGIATGTLFLYAEDKPDLLFLVYHDQLRAAFERARAGRMRGRKRGLLGELQAYFAPFFELYGQEPTLAVRFIGLRSTARGRNAKAMIDLNLEMVAHFGTLVAESIERGEVDPAIDVRQASFNIYAQYLGSLMGWALGFAATAAAAFDPVLKDALAVTIRGFAPPPAASK